MEGNLQYNDIPLCCRHCVNLEAYDSISFGEDVFFCVRKIYFPIKKQSCKKQKDWIPNREVKSCI